MARLPDPTPVVTADAVADWVLGLADQDLSDAERVEHLRLLEDLKTRIGGTQARLAADLDASVRARHADLKLPTAARGRGVAGEFALARRESPARGARLLGLANALTGELPHTLAAMEAGVLSEWRATLIARETACLDPDTRRAIDEQLCAPTPDGGYRFDGWGDRRLVAETRKLVYAADPAAVVNRRARAETERRVTLRPAPDTMTQLSALLPAAHGVAVWAVLSREADQQIARGDRRTRGQIMADTLVARITGQATADAVPVAVTLVVSDRTLLAGGHEPAWLHGHGPLGPDAARELAAHATADARATLRRLYATPATGTLVAMDSVARTFPDGLAALITARDQTCRTPWCDAPIRHTDHIVDHAAGGPTNLLNGQGLCEACNHTKQAPGWRTRPITGPPGRSNERHTVETVTPAGQTIRSVAPRAPTPATLRPVHRPDLEYPSHVRLDLHPDYGLDVA